MNKSTSFQPVSGVVLSGILPRCFPAFLTVWGGQTEREAAFLNVKLHAARFRVCVSLLADRRITAAVCKQTLFQGGVVSADISFVIRTVVFPFSQCSHNGICQSVHYSSKLTSCLIIQKGVFQIDAHSYTTFFRRYRDSRIRFALQLVHGSRLPVLSHKK